jgi:hypothetical protein
MDLHLQEKTDPSASVHRKGEALGSYPRGVRCREDDIHEVHAGIPKDFDTVKVFGLGMCDPPLYPNLVSTEHR